MHWYTAKRSHSKNILHYLDDFLFVGEVGTNQCANLLKTFTNVCQNWGVPLAEDKTVLPVEILTFLGIEFDTIATELRLPKVKLIEIKQRITVILGCKKVKLRELQSLIGLLNFACQVVVL